MVVFSLGCSYCDIGTKECYIELPNQYWSLNENKRTTELIWSQRGITRFTITLVTDGKRAEILFASQKSLINTKCFMSKKATKPMSSLFHSMSRIHVINLSRHWIKRKTAKHFVSAPT